MATKPLNPPPTREPPRVLYIILLRKGFAPSEAGNLVAYANGLQPPPTLKRAWKLKEIEGILFIRYLVENGTITSGEFDGANKN